MYQREQRPQQIVRLIGPDALPDTERLILVVSEMIKNGFLQQNAFDDIDVFSVPEKQIMILQLIIQYYKRAYSIIKQGAPLMKVTNLPVREEIVRIKTSIANDNLTQISAVESHLEEQISSLEKIYRRADVL